MLGRDLHYKDFSLSELSYIILGGNYSQSYIKKAEYEIKRRFSTNGCDFNNFMEYEKKAFSKRGTNKSKYLISCSSSGQLLMEIF